MAVNISGNTNIPFGAVSNKYPSDDDYYSSIAEIDILSSQNNALISQNDVLINSFADIIKNHYLMLLLKVAGEQRNSEAWSSYWNKIPKDVLNNKNMNYVIYATGSSSDIVKLDSGMNLIANADLEKTSVSGISLDISHSHVYQAYNDSSSDIYCLEKFDKTLTRIDVVCDNNISNGLQEINHITFGNDNMLYISGRGPYIEKWNPVSLTKLQENTDIWLTPETISSTDDEYQYIQKETPFRNDEWDEDGNGFTDESARTVISSGKWNLPVISMTDEQRSSPNTDLPHNVSLMAVPSFIDTNTQTSLRIDFTLNIRDNATYQISLHANNKALIRFKDSTTFDDSTNKIEANFNFNGTTSPNYKNITLNGGTTSSLEFQIFESRTGTATSDHLNCILAVKKSGETNWRNIPVFRGNFAYINYDPYYTLYAQSDYGIFKWDTQNMICLEAQPITNSNSSQAVNDVVVGKNSLYCAASSDLYSIDKNTLTSSLIISRGFNSNPATIHFLSENEILFGNGDNIFIFDIKNNTQKVDMPTNNYNILKLSITPDNFAYIGYDNQNSNPRIDKRSVEDIRNGIDRIIETHSLGSSCTGLVYDIE